MAQFLLYLLSRLLTLLIVYAAIMAVLLWFALPSKEEEPKSRIDQYMEEHEVATYRI